VGTDMDLFNRLRQRISIEIPVDVFLQNKTTGKISSRHVNGTLINLSKVGACIIITKVILDGSHLFFTSLEQAENNLFLKDISINDDVSCLVATAVWMDICTYNQQPSFKMGIKFQEHQKELYTTLKAKSH
jgi:hypothetical protein